MDVSLTIAMGLFVIFSFSKQPLIHADFIFIEVSLSECIHDAAQQLWFYNETERSVLHPGCKSHCCSVRTQLRHDSFRQWPVP